MISEREEFIVLVDNDCLARAEAIVLLEGDGLYRASKAVELYRSGMSELIILSGGANEPGYGSFPSELVMPELRGCGIPMSSLLQEQRSTNTLEQAQNVVSIAVDNHWESLILVASHYHQYRAYLTFLNVMLRRHLELVIMNAPANRLPWFAHQPWGARIELLHREFEKIEEYTSYGHLASYEQAIRYQRWKEEMILTKPEKYLGAASSVLSSLPGFQKESESQM